MSCKLFNGSFIYCFFFFFFKDLLAFVMWSFLEALASYSFYSVLLRWCDFKRTVMILFSFVKCRKTEAVSSFYIHPCICKKLLQMEWVMLSKHPVYEFNGNFFSVLFMYFGWF